MKFKFNVQITGMNKLRGELLKKQKKVLFLSMQKMMELAKRRAPVDTGRLRSSINLTPVYPGATKYTLADGVEYGVHVEYGTLPHFPPVKALADWSKRVLGDEKLGFIIARKIAMKGTPMQPFFRPSYFEVINYWLPKYWEQVLQTE